jgi:hypothetical protein
VAQTLPNKKYLIKSPSNDWKKFILSHGELVLGDMRFVAKFYDFRKFDGGTDPIILWINITGLPPDLWKDNEFHHIISKLGGYYVDVDPKS